MLLACEAFERGGPLPLIERSLAKIGMTAHETISGLLTDYPQLFDTSGGNLRVRMVDKELTYGRDKRRKRQEAGKAGAVAKWGKAPRGRSDDE